MEKEKEKAKVNHVQKQRQKLSQKEKAANYFSGGRPDRPVDSKGSGKGIPPPICFRCGKRGHISANCTNAPTAKRKKATDSAKKTLIKVPLREGRTLHHDIVGVHGSSKVVMRSAPSGTGIIAGGSVRAVFELLGVQDIVAKSVGSTNPYNIIRAAVDGLKNQKSPKIIAARRSKKVGNITSARESS